MPMCSGCCRLLGSRPIRGKWAFKKGELEDTGAKTTCFRQKMTRGNIDVSELGIKVTLVESQNKNIELEISRICLFLNHSR